MPPRNLRRPLLLIPLATLSSLCAVALCQPDRAASGTAREGAGPRQTAQADAARHGKADANAASEQSAPAPAPAPGSAPPHAPARSADAVLGDLLRPRRQGRQAELTVNEPPAEDRTSGDGAVRPNAPVVTVLREGTPIVNRIGRLTLGGSKANSTPQAEFTFEADGQALRDPPLIILPSLRLMAMEDAVRGASRDLRFRVSGMVTEYRGRNYLLLEKVTVVQDVTQQFK